MRIYFEDDADPQALKDGPIAVLGYGSQGRAHALNLRDSGYPVVVGLRPDGKTARAREGRRARGAQSGGGRAGRDAGRVPDARHDPPRPVRAGAGPASRRARRSCSRTASASITARSQPGKTHDVVLVAPKSPGDLVRRQYEAGQGVPCLLAVAQDATGRAKARALAYAHAIGGTRSGVLETSFAEETETDLFGEQAVLCGGATELVVKGYETLVEAGYQPEVAYFECLHELKLIVDLLYEGGLAKMHQFVSETAKYGDLTRGPRIIDDHVKARCRQVLEEIRSGQFAREWIAENADGPAALPRAVAARPRATRSSTSARTLRERMAWLKRAGGAPERRGGAGAERTVKGAEALLRGVARPGRRSRVRLSRRRDHAALRRAARVRHPAHPGAPRAGGRFRGRRLRARVRPAGRVHRDLRARARPTSSPASPNAFLDSVPHGRDHRPGRDSAHGHRRLPGSGHLRHHAADREAQLRRAAHRGAAAHRARGLGHRRERPARARC